MKFRNFWLILILSVSLWDTIQSQHRYYFYTGKLYGSESLINPGSLLVNAGFDILQSVPHSRKLSTIKFGIGVRNVYNNLSDPFTQIDKFGWKKFIGQEVFPLSLKIEEAQWFPNYTLHFIGGGMDARMMYEWYTVHNLPSPTLLAGLTIAAYHVVNEAVENDMFVGPNVDPIADIYIFNLGGALLFTSDAVAEFFSTTLHMTAWPGQPAWNPEFNTLENHGHYYVMKYQLPFAPTTSLFYHFGDNGLIGLSFLQPNNESVTLAVGATQRQLRTVDITNGARTVTVDLGWMAGIFYDRENSLLASIMASNRINEKLRLNLYPGVIDLWGFSPGLFAALGNRNQFMAGFSLQYSPVGLAYRNKL
ncbi:MAG: hypothetical protein M0R68_04375 [Bacteroidetes bacterium]|nr:hypothetical protein [Bacteroidota bacterium]